jgi:hypothetical protein
VLSFSPKSSGFGYDLEAVGIRVKIEFIIYMLETPTQALLLIITDDRVASAEESGGGM